jgi:hypothetical protein
MTTDSDKKKKQNDYLKKYREKKPHMNSYCTKKNYWKKWFDEEYIKELYDKHGDNAFSIMKIMKKEHKENLKEQQRKETSKLLLKSLKMITVN